MCITMCKKQFLVSLSVLFVSPHGKKHHCIVITLVDWCGCIGSSKPVDVGRTWCHEWDLRSRNTAIVQGWLMWQVTMVSLLSWTIFESSQWFVSIASPLELCMWHSIFNSMNLVWNIQLCLNEVGEYHNLLKVSRLYCYVVWISVEDIFLKVEYFFKVEFGVKHCIWHFSFLSILGELCCWYGTATPSDKLF